MADQIDGCPWLADAGPLGTSASHIVASATWVSAAGSPLSDVSWGSGIAEGVAFVNRAMSSTGTSMRSFNRFFAPASTIVTGR